MPLGDKTDKTYVLWTIQRRHIFGRQRSEKQCLHEGRQNPHCFETIGAEGTETDYLGGDEGKQIGGFTRQSETHQTLQVSSQGVKGLL